MVPLLIFSHLELLRQYSQEKIFNQKQEHKEPFSHYVTPKMSTQGKKVDKMLNCRNLT